MITLYSRLAGQWDRLFPPDPERELFLVGMLGPEAGRIVEVGCGSGATALFLAGRGHRVVATDPDPEMVKVARAVTVLGVEFLENDMLGTLVTMPPGNSDALLCLGNTLPHLDSFDELDEFLRHSAEILDKGGRVVIQILNYRRIMKAGRIDMPDIALDNLVFSRRQEYSSAEKRVIFSTSVRDADRSESRSHRMLPITPQDLEESAMRNGLHIAGLFGDWKQSIFRETDPWLAAVVRKD